MKRNQKTLSFDGAKIGTIRPIVLDDLYYFDTF
jgi:hypothetical protein